ncbi:hypothetical protein Ae505Ps2_4296 [Pseudonocardia sp. Ae505_Ps2]|nr:hypothetical protein Ae505Ps2_4296 [Pseudonocardia sp. Ae505_Ps2]
MRLGGLRCDAGRRVLHRSGSGSGSEDSPPDSG